MAGTSTAAWLSLAWLSPLLRLGCNTDLTNKLPERGMMSIQVCERGLTAGIMQAGNMRVHGPGCNELTFVVVLT